MALTKVAHAQKSHTSTAQGGLSAVEPEDLEDEEGVHEEEIGDLEALPDVEDPAICIKCHDPHASDNEMLLKDTEEGEAEEEEE